VKMERTGKKNIAKMVMVHNPASALIKHRR
jgi:hypothetical protein